MKPSTFSEPSIGLPNMGALTLLFRSASGYVETEPKSRGLMGYCESTASPLDNFQGRADAQRVRKGYGRAECGFPEYEVFDGLEPGTGRRHDLSFFHPFHP